MKDEPITPIPTGETPQIDYAPPQVGSGDPYDPAVEKRSRQVELIISLLLRWGMISSVTVILLGTILTFIHHPEYVTDRNSLAALTTTGGDYPHSIREIWIGLTQFEGRSVVILGLAMLIATPVLRVAVSAVAFAVEKDWLYVTITLTVLAILGLSFALGHVE